MLIGYLLNTHDEYGPMNIAFVPASADIVGAIIEYSIDNGCALGDEPELSPDKLATFVADLKPNYARDLINVWGGTQVTALHDTGDFQ
jgi:hypothetical protein